MSSAVTTTEVDELVQIDGVSKTFVASKTIVRAVDDVSLSIRRGECLALIGESGSGKSTLGRLLVGLERPDCGSIQVGDKDLAHASRRGMKDLRSALTTVFQEPFESLNPKRKVGESIAMPLRVHAPKMSGAARTQRVQEVCRSVRLPPELLNRYPGQLSGGQQQRVGIARALITSPVMMVLDEPTSALDASVRGQILGLLRRLQHEQSLTYLLITHDLRSVESLADSVAVMYRGRLVEVGTRDQVLNAPTHPYTQLLLSSAVSVPADGEREISRPPAPAPAAQVPAVHATSGCRFMPRCPMATERCAVGQVPLEPVEAGHLVACHHAPRPSPTEESEEP